jgi:hypothetical protein
MPPRNDGTILHRDPRDTEVAAVERIAPYALTQEQRVFEEIGRSTCDAHRRGATDSEVCRALSIWENSVQPRRKSLMDKGYVMDSGQRRPHLVTGNRTIVWCLTDLGMRVYRPQPIRRLVRRRRLIRVGGNYG